MEGSNTRTKCLVVEPGRGFLQVREEVAQYLGRFPQALILLLDAGPDEPVQIVRRQRGKLPHHLVQYGIANSGVLDVVVGRSLIVATGLRMTFDVCRWRLCHLSSS